MTTDLINILGLAFIGSIAGLIGGVVFLVKKSWSEKLSSYAVPFAAGVLISVSLIHLIPESMEGLKETAPVVVLFAFMLSFFFEQFFAHLHHHEERKQTRTRASIPLIIVGDTIHNFIDGVAIAAAYLTQPSFGLLVALATFLHETPHEIGDFGVMMAKGWKRKKVFLANLFSASATFPGALMVFYLSGLVDHFVGYMLAFAAGMFLYLGASDFLPEVGEESEGPSAWKNFVPLVIGVMVILILSLIAHV